MISEKARNRTGVGSPTGGPDAVAQEIAQLSTLGASALGQRWAQLLGDEPLPNLGRNMMIQAIAYRLQEAAFGGLKHQHCGYSTELSTDRDLKERNAHPRGRPPQERF